MTMAAQFGYDYLGLGDYLGYVGQYIIVLVVMLEGDTAVSWAHNVGLDSAYTLDIEHYGGAWGHRPCPELIIEVNSHAGRRHIHNLARVISAIHYRAAEIGDDVA